MKVVTLSGEQNCWRLQFEADCNKPDVVNITCTDFPPFLNLLGKQNE